MNLLVNMYFDFAIRYTLRILMRPIKQIRLSIVLFYGELDSLIFPRFFHAFVNRSFGVIIVAIPLPAPFVKPSSVFIQCSVQL